MEASEVVAKRMVEVMGHLRVGVMGHLMAEVEKEVGRGEATVSWTAVAVGGVAVLDFPVEGNQGSGAGLALDSVVGQWDSEGVDLAGESDEEMEASLE